MGQLADRIDTNHTRAVTGMDVSWLLDQWVSRTPNAPFMYWEPFAGAGDTWTFTRLQREARAIAAGLAERGVKPGDFVIIHMDNSPEFVLSWFACAQLGAVAVSTNTRSVARDLEYFADHTAAVCALTQPGFAPMIRDACPGLRFVAVTDNDAGVPVEFDPAAGAVQFGELLAGDTPVAPRPIEPMANLSVQFTSGTTARPKAVLWTHANGIWGARTCASHMRLRRTDRTLIFMPLFHTNAQAYSMLATLWSGGCFVLQPKFSASRFWPLSLKYQLTWLSTIPFAFKAIADQPVPDHSYRLWGTAAHLPQIEDHFRVQVMGWWGMTETLTHGIVTDLDHPGPAGTIGRVAPEYEIEIRREDGSLAAAGERGLLFIRGVRGVSLFKEYYRNDAANLQAFDQDGFFETGDRVLMNEDGWLFFSDRDKDMLKIGAENVAASEIESVMQQTGLVAEVAVVAQRHRMLDEVPVAFVIPSTSPPPADLSLRLIEYCRENLADFKVPVAVHVVDELPRSTLEKVAKNQLRDRLTEVLG